MKGSDTLVTFGGIQSNHARQTAAAAAKFGLGCELVLENVDANPEIEYYQNGNLLLDKIMGANIHLLPPNEAASSYAYDLVSKLFKQGKTPYLIPVGGSNILGSYGYVRCATEIVEQLTEHQLNIDQIILASGSGGTHAGLLAGLIASKIDISVLGISISRSKENQESLVKALLVSILNDLGELEQELENKVIINGGYVGSGYGMTTEPMFAAVKVCAELEGVLLDPVYTGKAMAGLIDLCEKGEISQGSDLLFLHTGGSQGLHAYCETFGF